MYYRRSQNSTVFVFKVPFFAHFQAILIFETKKVIISFILKHLLSYLSQILTSLQDFRQSLIYKSTGQGRNQDLNLL